MNSSRYSDFNMYFLLGTARTQVTWLDCSKLGPFEQISSQKAAISESKISFYWSAKEKKGRYFMNSSRYSDFNLYFLLGTARPQVTWLDKAVSQCGLHSGLDLGLPSGSPRV